MTIETKVCQLCKKELLLTESNFRYFKSGRWGKACRLCNKLETDKAKIMRALPKKKPQPKNKNTAVTIGRDWHRVDVYSVRPNNGEIYKVIDQAVKEKTKEVYRVSVGKVIYQNDCFFILEDENNIRESFLKVDSLLNIYKLEKVRG